MIKNYLKTAYRSLIRHKAFSVINIAGLAIGIASCLLLFTVIKYELSYDGFQPNYKQLYRVITQNKNAEGINYTPGVPSPLVQALRTDIPQVTIGTLVANYGSQVTVLGSDAATQFSGKKFIEKTGFFFADPQFFEVFQYKWLAGAGTVLKDPNNTVLTKKLAEKYFGDWKNAMGKFVKLDNTVTVKVAGILEDVPVNTDFPFAIITSLETAKANSELYFYSDEWGSVSSNFQIYMKLPKAMSASNVSDQLATLSRKYYADAKRNERTNLLEPLSELHFDKRVESFGDHITDKSSLWTLGLIGLFIILMACINFINLSTAQAVGRSKEIGIRKVLGSLRKQLLAQVMGETAFIVVSSVILAFFIAFISLPFIKHVTSISESLSLLNIQTLLFAISVTITVTILAGLYPAMILSGFKPVLALKNKITSASIGGISLRRGLVVAQFAISQVLIIGTIVAVSQMNYVRNADLGFSKEAVLLINANADSAAQSRQQQFARQLTDINGVEAVSFSSDVPSSENNWGTNFAYDHRPDENYSLYMKFADENYFKTYGLKLIAGRVYVESDTLNEVIVNETLIKKLGITDPASAIGKEIRMGSQPWSKIVGIAKDFKTNSLKEDIKPLIISQLRKYYSVTAVKMKSTNIRSTQQTVEARWNKVFPEYAYSTSYMDEDIASFYDQDEKLALMYKIFAGIAIFISCLGLYGLVSFMAVQKTKEIGVRKVLGASVGNIIYLFSKEFTVLIFIGSVIAIPVAYYMMSHWLQNFVYRVQITAVVFIISICLSLLIAWVAVGYKSIKAALANPVKSIRTE